MKTSIVGKSKKRNDAYSKVTGRAKFVDDYFFDNMVHAVTIRNPYPHTLIKKINLETIEKSKGVIKVITHKDVIGNNRVPLVFNDYPFFIEKIGKFYGQPIGLIIADTKENALKALQKVKIDYKKLPYITDPLKSINNKKVKLYEKNNIFKDYIIKKGDIKKGFNNADVILENTYRTNYQVHTYMEPSGMVAVPGDRDNINVFGTMQCPFYVQDAVAEILGMKKSKVRIVQTTVGGAFGGKEDVPSIVAGHCALAAYIVKRPVKLIYSREEDFHSMSKRHPGWIKIKYGAKKDGTLVACKVKYILDGGAYSTLSPIVLWRGTVHATGPYAIPNVLIESCAVATNKVPCGAYRGFGQPQVSFANESLIDELANKLEIDSLKLREKNMLVTGKRTATNQKVSSSCGMEEALKIVADRGKKRFNSIKKKYSRISNKKLGLGYSLTYYGVGLGAGGQHLARTGAFVQVEQDGSVRVAVGNTEMGQGAYTILAQIAAETLGAPYKEVFVLDSDTTRVPDSGPTVASRTTVMSGKAVYNACSLIKKNMISAVAQAFNVNPNKIVNEKKYFYVKNNRKKKLDYYKVIELCYANRIQLSFEGWNVAPECTYNETGQGDAYFVYTFSANAAIVEIDEITHRIKLLNIISAHDIGKAINPQQVEGQIQGGALQGAGYAVMENLVVTDGIIQNPNFTGYIIPTTVDAPNIDPIYLEYAYDKGPYGAKGLGEPPLMGIAPAVGNAVYNASGIRIRKTPILPEDIYEKNENS